MKFVILLCLLGSSSSLRKKQKSLNVMSPETQKDFLERVALVSRATASVANDGIFSAIRDLNQSMITLIQDLSFDQSQSYNTTSNRSFASSHNKHQVIDDPNFYLGIAILLTQALVMCGVFIILRRRKAAPLRSSHAKCFRFKPRPPSQLILSNSRPDWDTLARVGPEAVTSFSTVTRTDPVPGLPPPFIKHPSN